MLLRRLKIRIDGGRREEREREREHFFFKKKIIMMNALYIVLCVSVRVNFVSLMIWYFRVLVWEFMAQTAQNGSLQCRLASHLRMSLGFCF